MSDSAAVPAPAQSGLTHKQIRTILIGLMAGMFLAALDQTIVSTSIRVIGDDLGGLDLLAWVTTAYLITSTVTTPLYGKLSDIYGRRPLFLTAIVLFIIGSIACAFAQSMYQLAAFRAFQGLGAGGLFSLALAILADIVPPRQRAKYQGYFLAVFGTSSVIGPVVGGAFAGADTILGITGWRWVFLINVPIGLVAMIVVARVLHLPHIRHDHRIDWWGAAALIVGIVPLLIVAEQGREWGWGSPQALTMMALVVIGITAFIVIEFRMGDEALIPMRLFRSTVFSLGLGINVLIGLGMFGALSTLPLYLQMVKGASPTASGLLLIPMMIGIMAGSVLSGQLTARTGRYKIFPVIGAALLSVAFLLLLTVEVDTPYWQLDIYFLLIGLGLGLNMQTMLIAVQNAVPARDMGVATSSATFFRQLGGTLGVAIFISLLFNSLPKKITGTVSQAVTDPQFLAAMAADGYTTPAEIQARLVELGQQMSLDSSFLQTMNPVITLPYKEGFVESTHMVYVVAAAIMMVAFVLTLMLKEVPLRTMSAIEELQADQAALMNADAETVQRVVDDELAEHVGRHAAGSPGALTKGDGPAAVIAGESEPSGKHSR